MLETAKCNTAWKVSKYEVISGPYFPVFGLNTEIYSEITPHLDTFYAAQVNSGYITISLQYRSHWKCCFVIFGSLIFFNFRATFAKTLMKKSPFLWQSFKTFMKLCYLPKFYHVEIFERIIAVLRIFFAFYRKVRFLCLLLSLGISYYYLFMATENCKSVCILLVFKYRSNHFLK